MSKSLTSQVASWICGVYNEEKTWDSSCTSRLQHGGLIVTKGGGVTITKHIKVWINLGK